MMPSTLNEAVLEERCLTLTAAAADLRNMADALEDAAHNTHPLAGQVDLYVRVRWVG